MEEFSGVSVLENDLPNSIVDKIIAPMWRVLQVYLAEFNTLCGFQVAHES
jgi:hypothetical protein